MLNRALATIPDKRGQGIDFLEPRLPKQASDDAKLHLIDGLRSIEDQCTLPFQQLFSLIAWLPKPDG
eukprot:8673395-Pyramimonas_sp.AAC.1